MSESKGMIQIEVSVSTGLVGSKVTDTFEIEADASEAEIEEAAKDVMFNMIEWNWKKVDE